MQLAVFTGGLGVIMFFAVIAIAIRLWLGVW